MFRLAELEPKRYSIERIDEKLIHDTIQLLEATSFQNDFESQKSVTKQYTRVLNFLGLHHPFQIEIYRPTLSKNEFSENYRKPMQNEFCAKKNSMFSKCFQYKSKTCTKVFDDFYQKCLSRVVPQKAIPYYLNEEPILKKLAGCVGDEYFASKSIKFKKGISECETRSNWQ